MSMKPVANLADILEIEAQGWAEDLPRSTYDLIQRTASLNPDAPALSFFMTAANMRETETWSYRALMGRITQAANAFHALGLGPEEVVTYLLPNLPETHFTIWGGEAAGVVAAINPLLETSALATLLGVARTKILVTLAPFPGVDLWSRLQPIFARVESLEHLVLVNLADRIPGPTGAEMREAQKREVERLCGPVGIRGKVPAHIAVHDFKTLLDGQPDDRLCSGRVISSGDRSSLFCTGGTTGLPKIAVRLHGNEVADAWSMHRVMGDSIRPGKTMLCGLPLFHVNAFMVTGLLAFSAGCHVILATPQGYRGDGVVARFWEIVEHHRINSFAGVPTLYAALMQVPVAGRDISCLDYGYCGAAPMPVEVFRSFEERTDIKILEGYGLTEGTCISSCNPPIGERRVGSIGLRLPGQLMKAVVLDEQGRYVRDCAVDEVGVITISGPNVFSGYVSAEHDAGLWLDCGDGRRWLNTGDLGRQDADGYFWLTGRKKELIIRGGHNIDPLSIEEPLHQHPAVQLVAAVGRPDAYAGELPVAYVQLKPGCTATEEELAEFARSTIGERAALPKHIRIVEEMPVTAVGKIFKPALKQREIRDAIVEALKEAGLSPGEVTVADVRGQGMTVGVKLADIESESAVRKVLGSFPYPFSIH